MTQEDFCSGCPQSRDCKAVYEQVGKSTAPDVTKKVLVAFLLPVAVFIASLALFDCLFAKVNFGNDVRIVAAFVPAAGVSLVGILIARMINLRLAKRQAHEKIEGDTKSQTKQD